MSTHVETFIKVFHHQKLAFQKLYIKKNTKGNNVSSLRNIIEHSMFKLKSFANFLPGFRVSCRKSKVRLIKIIKKFHATFFKKLHQAITSQSFPFLIYCWFLNPYCSLSRFPVLVFMLLIVWQLCDAISPVEVQRKLFKKLEL